MPCDFIEYAYNHYQTRETTGYFSCVPLDIAANIPEDFSQDMASLSELFTLLNQRPLDVFLHRYILSQLLALDAGQLVNLAQMCINPPHNEKLGTIPISQLASLLLECAILDTSCAKALEPYSSPLRDMLSTKELSTPLPILLLNSVDNQKNIKAWASCFKDNIHKHKAIAKTGSPLLYTQNEIDSSLENTNCLSDIFHDPGVQDNDSSVDPKVTYSRAVEILEKAEILAGPEMRHEASLSPIALLRQWHINIKVNNAQTAHTLRGIATAYGRGLSLAAARAACAMEIIERASAYASVEVEGQWNNGHISGTRLDLLYAAPSTLKKSDYRFIIPSCGVVSLDTSIYWVPGINSRGEQVFAPAQSVFLFSNLGEPVFYENHGSTGLGAGNTLAEAKLAALLEVIERDAHATTPFMEKHCFILASRDERIQSLLDDYNARHIYPVFQDITPESGVPAYRCFVKGLDGEVMQATGANLSGAHAAISALTETPWPYVWAMPAPFGKPSARPVASLPLRYLEDLPDFSLPSTAQRLNLLERALGKKEPVYVEITREDLKFPVVRAFVPGFEADADFDFFSPPGMRLFARWQRMY